MHKFFFIFFMNYFIFCKVEAVRSVLFCILIRKWLYRRTCITPGESGKLCHPANIICPTLTFQKYACYNRIHTEVIICVYGSPGMDRPA